MMLRHVVFGLATLAAVYGASCVLGALLAQRAADRAYRDVPRAE